MTNNPSAVFAVKLVFAAFTLVLIGFALQDIWGWFIVPFGLPNLSFWHAVGINLLVGALTFDPYQAAFWNRDDDLKRHIEASVYSIVGWLVFWGLGAVYAWADNL